MEKRKINYFSRQILRKRARILTKLAGLEQDLDTLQNHQPKDWAEVNNDTLERETIMQNVDAALHDDPDRIRENLSRQLYSPVQWVASVQAMGKQGVTRIIEAGPGKVLTGLCKRIDKTLLATAVFDGPSLASALGR